MCTVAALAGVIVVGYDISCNNSQCLENLTLMRHSLMIVEFGARGLD